MTADKHRKAASEGDYPWWLVALGLIALLLAYLIVANDLYSQVFVIVSAGIGITVLVTLIAFLLATLLGLGIALMGLSQRLVVRQIARFYTEVIRGIPILVLLFYIAFVGAPGIVVGVDGTGTALRAVGWAAVEARVSILVSGGTGSGKTTLLNALSEFIPADERLITIEDTAELQLRRPHVVSLETRPAGADGGTEVRQRELVRNALRMRPDRIIVGEVRGAEALDMLQAMNTGHEGSLTTIHANDTADALTRLEMMCLLAGAELPVPVVRHAITTAITLVVQVARLRGGARRVVRVSELLGTDPGPYHTREVFGYRQTGVRDGAAVGEFTASGYRPKVLERLAAAGCEVADDLFLAGAVPDAPPGGG